MFTDENHIISCLINRYNHKIFPKKTVHLTSNKFYRSTSYFIFKGMIFFHLLMTKHDLSTLQNGSSGGLCHLMFSK